MKAKPNCQNRLKRRVLTNHTRFKFGAWTKSTAYALVAGAVAFAIVPYILSDSALAAERPHCEISRPIPLPGNCICPPGTYAVAVLNWQPDSFECRIRSSSHRHVSKPIGEDDPRYMEGYVPPASSIPRSRPNGSSHASRPPPERPPQDDGESGNSTPANPYAKPPDIPVPGP
jgi:hypothetical protein